jgi:8-oxo-dGTP diphosphatase
MSSPKVCSLLFLVRDDTILLAMKKRGFGKGRWNGVGGKVEPGETLEEAMVRESQEEIGVTPLQYDKVAVHDFLFPDGTSDMQVHTYVSRKWQGDPIETDEMAPQWFPQNAIPYADMWQDDIYWLPAVLLGKRLQTRFTFDEQENLLAAQIMVMVDIVD